MATSPGSSISNSVFAGMAPPFAWAEVLQREPHHEPNRSVAAPLLSPQVTAPAQTAVERDKVLLAHMPLVHFVARSIYKRLPQHVELEDLVSAGVVGLIDAFNKFDTGKNVQFKSYAQFRIRGAILDSLRNLDWGSRELRRKGRDLEAARQTLVQRLGRWPSETEVAAELGLALDAYQQLLSALNNLEIDSLNEIHAEDSAEEELSRLPANPEDDPLNRSMQQETSSRLRTAIAALPTREGRVLALYYWQDMTLKEIGAVLGLGESRVSQIRSSAMAGLRAQLNGTPLQTENQTGIKSSPVLKRPPQMVPQAVIQKSVACSRGGHSRLG